MRDLTVGDRLRQERERLGMSQSTFGEWGGVSKVAQINYETGKRSPKASYFDALARIGVDISYVLSGKRRDPAEKVFDPDEDIAKPVPQIEPVGLRIAEWRSAARHTRSAAAALLGISADELKDIEQGRIKAPWRVLSRLVNEHGINGDWLLWEIGEPTPALAALPKSSR